MRKADLVERAAQAWGLQSLESHRLPSEVDENYALETSSGKRFVLKISQRDHAELDFENQILLKLAESDRLPTARPLKSSDGRWMVPTADGRQARLLTHLPGREMGRLRYHSPELLEGLGRILADVNRVLADIAHPAMHRDLTWDLARAGLVIESQAAAIQDSACKAMVEQVGQRFQEHTAPRLEALPSQIIHNDANEMNILVSEGKISGLLDFGDALHTRRVCEVAIASAYAGLNKLEPLRAAVRVLRGYHARYPLQQQEIALLYDLIRTRLAVSLTISASRKGSGNAYHQISAEPARRALELLSQVPPDLAHFSFRQACGLPPNPNLRKLTDWLYAKQRRFGRVLEPGNVQPGTPARPAPEAHRQATANAQPPVPPAASTPAGQRSLHAIALQLTPDSPLSPDPSDSDWRLQFHARLTSYLQENHVQLGIGRYDEPRLPLPADSFAVRTDDGTEFCSIHLGIDLFAPPGTTVRAPLDGVVHSLPGTDSAGAFRSTLVLQHQAEKITFFTLYRHLSRATLPDYQPGQRIRAGEAIGQLAKPSGPAGRAGQLHFQIISHLMGYTNDFPGLARPSESQVFKSICPDPDLILKYGVEMPDSDSTSTAELLARRQASLGGNLSLSYRRPIQIVRGRGQYLYDAQGQRYLDCVNNVSHVGHGHPGVVRAVSEQARILNTNTRYLHEHILRLAERLGERLPGALKVCYFVNSGSEANDLALRMARASTGKRDLLVLEGAYHGHLTTLIDVSPYKHGGPGGAGPPDWVHTLDMPCKFRGVHRRRADPVSAYAAAARKAIAQAESGGGGIAGFIGEAIMGTGGQVVFPEGYLQAIYGLVRAAGGLCIADEVQVGFGRVGSHFWGFETHGVVPDIVTLGKPMGNGHPLAAVVTTPEIAAAFDNGMEYFNTFGGNPVSCAAGLAVLDAIEAENLQSKAQRLGDLLLAGLDTLKGHFDIVGDVRGAGLFLGIELVADRGSLEPADREASYLVERMRERGILLSTDGPYRNVIKFKPPMVFEEVDARRLLSELEEVLAEIESESIDPAR